MSPAFAIDATALAVGARRGRKLGIAALADVIDVAITIDGERADRHACRRLHAGVTVGGGRSCVDGRAQSRPTTWENGEPRVPKQRRIAIDLISIVADPQLLQRRIRTSVPSRDRSIADVLQIVDAHPRGPEAAAVRSRKLLKNATPCACSRLRARDGHAMSSSTAVRSRIGAVEEHLVEPLLAFDVEPREAAAHRDLARRLIDHHEVHELRNAGIGGAAGAFVFRNHDVGEDPHQSEFVAVKNFGANGAAGRARGLRGPRGLRGFGLGPREGGGRRGQQNLRARRAGLSAVAFESRGGFISCPPSAAPRCTRSCASPAPGWSRSRSYPGWSRTDRRR